MNGCFAQERTVTKNEAMSESRTERSFIGGYRSQHYFRLLFI